MLKNNWKDIKMATEYTRNALPFQRQMAEKLAGFPVPSPAQPSKNPRISGKYLIGNLD